MWWKSPEIAASRPISGSRVEGFHYMNSYEIFRVHTNETTGNRYGRKNRERNEFVYQTFYKSIKSVARLFLVCGNLVMFTEKTSRVFVVLRGQSLVATRRGYGMAVWLRPHPWHSCCYQIFSSSLLTFFLSTTRTALSCTWPHLLKSVENSPEEAHFSAAQKHRNKKLRRIELTNTAASI